MPATPPDQNPDRWAMAILIACLLLLPPFFVGGSGSTGLFGLQSAILLLVLLTGVTLPADRPVAWYLLAAVTGWAAVAAVGAAYRFGTFVSLFDLVLFFLLITVLLGRTWSAVERRGVQWLVIGSGTLQALAALVQVAADPAVRATAWFENPNHLAAFLGVGIWAAAGRVLAGSGRVERIGAALCLLAGLAAMLATGSRGALIALVAVITIGVAGFARRLGRRRAAVAAIAVVLLVAAGAIAVVSRFQARPDPYRFARIRIWTAALRVAADHPVFGVGPGMLESRAQNYNPPEPGAPIRYSKRFLSAHNSYLQAAAEIGFPGLLLALGAAVATLRWLLRRPPGGSIAWTAPALAALLLHALVDDLIGVPAVMLVIGIPIGIGWHAAVSPAALTGAESGWSWRRCWPMALAAIYIWIALIVHPYLADRGFRQMLRATDGAGFGSALRQALHYNPYQPYYYWEATRRGCRSIRTLDRNSYALCHGYLRTAIKLEPGDARFHLELARLEARAFGELFGDQPARDRSLESYRLAARHNRTDPRPRVERARFQRRFGMYQEALAALDEALDIEPAYLGARLERLEVLRDLGWGRQVRSGAGELEDLIRQFASYTPRNDYERSLLAVDDDRWQKVRSMLPPTPRPLP